MDKDMDDGQKMYIRIENHGYFPAYIVFSRGLIPILSLFASRV